MQGELADDIALMAAAIYGPLLADYMKAGRGVTAEGFTILRCTAIDQAMALRREVYLTPWPTTD
jgi:hypothetical protein